MIDKPGLAMAGSQTGQRHGGLQAFARLGFALVLGLVLFPVGQAAAQHNISGRVTSSALAPLIGVNVVVEGTTIGTITNAAGIFTLSAPSGTGNLVFSALGYQSQTVPIEGRSQINLSLQESAVALEGIVVVGYGTQTRATVSGSVSSVNAADLENTASTTTADALVGRIQGINTRMTTAGFGRDAATGDVQDGRPGGASTIQIRNMGTPLFVIDGVPTDNPNAFNHLNPADIENISILKDASASVYGFRAANGVILVTTKKGSADGPPRVRFDGYYGWQNFTRYHYKDLASAYDYKFSEADSRNNLNQAQSITPEELENWRIGAPGFESTNHYPLVVNNPNAPQYNLNASVTGGSSNSQYYLSLGHVNQEYVFRDNSFNRTNLQANLSSSLTDGFRVGAELSANQQLQDNIAVQGDQDVVRSMLLGIHSSWPFENPWVDPETRTMIDYNVRRIDRTVGMYSQDISGWQEDLRRRLQGNVWAEYTFPFGTVVRGTYSHGLNLRNFDKQQYSFNAWDCDDNSDISTCVERDARAPRVRQQVKREAVDHFAQISANQSFEFGSHSLAGTGAFELNGTQFDETSVNAVPPNNLSHLIRVTDISGLGNDWGITRRASVAGRLNYDYAEKYLVELLGRYDGSYRFAPDSRWGFFPGVTLGWRVTQEPFLQDRFAWLNELKLRASWGETGREPGNQDLPQWGYLAGGTYGVGSAADPGGSVMDGTLVPGLRPRGLPITELSWVTATMKNAGFDVILFDNRLSGEFDLFERQLSGLPAARYDVLIPIEVGYTLPNENLESEVNRGFEMILRYNDQIGPVSFSLAPNFTFSRRKVLETYKPRFGNSWDQYRNGEDDRWASVNFGYRVLGQFQTMQEIEDHLVNIDGQGNRTLLPGDLIYEDINGDGIINAMDNRPIGYATDETPIMSFGMNNSFSFRGITLNLDWAGGAGFAHSRGAETKNMFQGGHNAQAYFMDRWHRVDPFNPQSEWVPGRYPPFRQGPALSSFNKNDTFWRTNIRYIRLRRAELGYSIPNDLTSNIGLSGVRVFTSATNPLTYDNVSHYKIDPEVVQGTALVYPTVSVVNVGFSASLGGATDSAAVVPVPPTD